MCVCVCVTCAHVRTCTSRSDLWKWWRWGLGEKHSGRALWKAGERSIFIRTIWEASLRHCLFDKYVTTSLSVSLPASSLLIFYVPQYWALICPQTHVALTSTPLPDSTSPRTLTWCLRRGSPCHPPGRCRPLTGAFSFTWNKPTRVAVTCTITVPFPSPHRHGHPHARAHITVNVSNPLVLTAHGPVFPITSHSNLVR